MKILLITNFYYPEKTGIAVTATDCARFLQELGHQVSVITTMPYYPEWDIHEGYQRKIWNEELIDGIPVKRVWQYVPGQPSTMKRILHELTGSGMSFFRGLVQSSDLVLAISPPLTLGFAAMVLAKVRGKRFWSSIKDIQPDAALALGMLKNQTMVRFSYWMEKQIYAHSEKILVLSDGMKRNLEKKGVVSSRIAVVPDSIDSSELCEDKADTTKTTAFREDHGLSDKFLILYSGNLGIKHNVEIIPEAARLLREHNDIFFAIAGEGAAKPGVLEKIEKYALTNIRVLPLCPRECLKDMLASADILLAPQRKEVLDIVVPSKLLAYLSTAKPIIASVDRESEAATVLAEHQAGKLLEPENARALADAILELKNDPAQCDQLGARGLELVRKNYDHQVVKEACYRPLFGEG